MGKTAVRMRAGAAKRDYRAQRRRQGDEVRQKSCGTTLGKIKLDPPCDAGRPTQRDATTMPKIRHQAPHRGETPTTTIHLKRKKTDEGGPELVTLEEFS